MLASTLLIAATTFPSHHVEVLGSGAAFVSPARENEITLESGYLAGLLGAYWLRLGRVELGLNASAHAVVSKEASGTAESAGASVRVRGDATSTPFFGLGASALRVDEKSDFGTHTWMMGPQFHLAFGGIFEAGPIALVAQLRGSIARGTAHVDTARTGDAGVFAAYLDIGARFNL